MHRMKCVICLLVLLAFPVGTFSEELMFRHLEAEEGLSNSQINTIFQDSRGFVWFGTSSGLNRYDGYRMQVYRSRVNDVRSLPDSYIREICEDGEGQLWVRTSVGYALYEPDTDKFNRDIRQHVFQYGLDAEPTSVYVDKKGNFWFYVSGKGCYWYNVSQKILYPFLQGEKSGLLPMGEITAITECQEGVLLVYNTGLLACVNGDLRRIVWMNDYIPASSSVTTSYAAFVDKNENVWVYGISGIRVYNKEKNLWVPSLPSLAEQWGIPVIPEMEDAIVGVAQDVHGRLWLATRHYGALVVDPQNKHFVWARSDKSNRRALKHDSMRSIYASPDKNVIWLGTAKSGIAYYAESAFKFHTEVKVDVTAIAPDGDDAYWVGTSAHGILHYSPSTGECTSLKTTVDLSKHEIFSLLSARDGSLWVGTNKGRLFRLHRGGETAYRIVKGVDSYLPADFAITSLLEDDRGIIWVATLGAGLQRLEPQTGKIHVYGMERHRLPSNKVNSLSLTKERRLLLGTPNGVALLDPVKNTVVSYTGCRSGNVPFTSLYVNQVVEDYRGLWWIATRDGVNVYDPANDRLDVIGAAEGLRNAVVCGVVPSGEQTVWASTAGGVTNIVVDKNETGTGYLYRIYNYTEEDGLQGYEFNQRSIWVKPNGEVAVGGIHGLNVFHPNEIVYNKKMPHVVFSGLLIFDKEVSVGERVNGLVPLKSGIASGHKVELDARHHSVFTILFGSDDYCVPFKNSFKYKLEGFHNDWLDCHPLRSGVTFTNLSPGKYILKVKAINSDGYSSNEVSQLTIVVNGSIWSSWWAWMVYALLLVVFVVVALLVWRRRESVRIRRTLLAEGALVVPAVSEKQDVADGAEEQDAVVTQDLSLADTKTVPSIVVVDENPEFLSYICDSLGGDYQVQAFTVADRAWESLLEKRPTAVLLSVASPDSEVYVLGYRIKNDIRMSALPVMSLVSREMNTAPVSGNGISDVCLEKPFTREMLQNSLHNLISGNHFPLQRRADKELIGEGRTEAVEPVSDADDQLVANATRYVVENLSRSDLSVEEMAREMGMSRAHLYKRLMAACGKTPIEFIRNIRLKRASELLKDSRYNVSEVAYQVGFNSPKYFSKYFSEAYGILPSAWQDKYRDKKN